MATPVCNAVSSVISPVFYSTCRILSSPTPLQLPRGVILERYVNFGGRIVAALDRPLTAAEEALHFEKMLSRVSTKLQ